MRLPRDTPSYLIALATVALLLFVAWRVGIIIDDGERRAQRAEERNEQLVEMLIEGRDEWSPQLEHIHEMVNRLCDANPDCER